MQLDVLEIELANRLNAQFAVNGITDKYMAAPIPENTALVEDLNRQEKAKAVVQVIEGLGHSSQSVNHVVQAVTIVVRVILYAGKLRGAGGLYNLMHYVNRILIGYKPANAENRMILKRFRLDDQTDNGIQNFVEYECKFINAQVFDDFANDVDLLETFKKINSVYNEQIHVQV